MSYNAGLFVQKRQHIKKIEVVFFDCNVRINMTDVIEDNRVMVELIMRGDERHFHL